MPDIPAGAGVILPLLIALTAVIVTGRLLGRAFAAIGQPPVIGEVIAGVVLGPSVLGALWPDAGAFILPSSVAPSLGVVAQLGVILYMFLVGLELNPDALRGQLRATVAISQTSIVVPFILGWALAVYLYPRFSSADVPFVSFALFLGIAMSITAFPVLARILSDLGMTRTPLGVVALTCAAIDDVTAWCLLALVVGVVQASAGSALTTIVLTLLFIAAMLVSALITESIGVHAIFGAFLLGAVIPHDSRLAHAMVGSLETLVTVLLLPAFFAFAGMRTEIGLLTGAGPWIACGLIILVATVGKAAGTFVAARLTGMSARDAAGLGVLMNTRGLMQLIVLNVGLDLGVISPTLFTMMVLMALATTLATTPVLRALRLPAHS